MSLQSGRLRGRLRSCSIFFSFSGSRDGFLNSGGGGILGGRGGGGGGGVGLSRPGYFREHNVSMMVPSSSMVVVALSLLGVVSALPAGQNNSKLKSDSPYPFPYVTRAQWRGRPPTSITPLVSPAPLVLIHHSFEPAACRDRAECSRAMRLMQDYHQMHQGWADIGYNFAVGSDGVVYEARGWTTVGAHASSYNSKSIGIVLIGDWIETVPPPAQLQAAKDLIRTGVERGFISPEYTLAGHRNVGSTECPGQALYEEIQTWEHFSDTL